MTIYILVFSNSFGELTALNQLMSDKEFAVEKRENISNCIFFKSPIDDVDIVAGRIQELYPNKRFFVMDVNSNRQGWLPRDTWAFLRS